MFFGSVKFILYVYLLLTAIAIRKGIFDNIAIISNTYFL